MERPTNKQFARASAFFLTEELTRDEYNDILLDGEILPTSEDFEDWDVDYLEQQIELLAEAFKKQDDKFDKLLSAAREVSAVITHSIDDMWEGDLKEPVSCVKLDNISKELDAMDELLK